MTTALQVSRRSSSPARPPRPAGSRSASTSRSPATPPPQGAMAPEVNAWVVIKPDDTVVIRIARSEMGQGTLTGLAQLVAEELECDWSKVTTEYPTPGQNLARNRVWGRLLDRRQPRHPRVARVRPQGRRRGARDADPGGGERLERAGLRMHGREERDHAHAVRPHDDLRQGRGRGRQARAAEGRQAQGPEGLEDRRQAAARLDTADKLTGKQVYGIDLKLPGHAQRRDQGLPGLRRQGEELRRRQGRRACRASRRSCRSATPPSPSSPTPGGRPRPRSTRCRSSGTRARTPRSRATPSPQMLKEGLDAHGQAFVGNQAGDAKAALAERGEEGRGGLHLPLPEPRHHGADERDGALDGRQVRGLDADPERRGGACRGVRGLRPADRASATSTSCISAAASAGAAPSTTTSARRSRSPSRCRARRSS